MPSDKSSLSIRLNEPVVPLRRTYDHSSRNLDDDETLQPAVVRGLLSLHLAKPTKISSIELGLKAKAVTHYLQGAGPGRIDVTEKYNVHSAASVVFKAEPVPQVRRTTSARHTVHFLDQRAGSASHDVHLDGVGSGRSASIDPQSSRVGPPTPISSDYSEADNSRNPHQDQVSSDPAPPYANSADQYFCSPDAIAAGSQTVASGSRTTETPTSLSVTSSQGHLLTDIPTDSSESSIHLPSDTGQSSRLSFDDYGLHSESVADYGLSRTRTGSSAPSLERGRRGSSHQAFSFGKAVHVFGMVKDRMRSRSRSDENEERGRPLTKVKPPVSIDPVEPDLHQIGVTEPSVGTTYQSGDGWVLFPEGTYTYPIFFTIPNDSPPTMKADRGSLTWNVKAVVRRPSAFAMKMSVQKEVIVICVPKANRSEEMGIDVQREWDNQFQYRLQITGQGIPIGGKLPFHLSITPLAKIKVHSIMIYLDERTEYYTRAGSRVRTDAIQRTTLLAIRHDGAHQRFSDPILPMAPDEPFRMSPLYQFLRPEEDESEVASSFMELGSWTIRHQLAVPDSCSLLHPSNRTPRSNVMVDHTLKVVLRVEKDDATVTIGRRKLYDIAIHAPIQIFSCRCTSEWSSLPRYDEAMRSEGDFPEETLACPCRTRQSRKDTHATPGALPFFHTRVTSLPTPDRSPWDSMASRARVYERLISGLVSERGEAPPSYSQPCEDVYV